MTPAALIMMVITILLVWGGLVAALVHLRGHPDEPTDEYVETPGSVPPG